MVKGFKKKLIALILSVSVAAAGVTAVVVNYRDGDFQPDAYAKNRERNENQIVFPGQDMSSLGDETSDESELWEQDKNSDENLKPEDKPSNSVLFETMKVADASADTVQPLPTSEEQAEEQPSDDTVYIPDAKTDTKPNHKKEDVVVIPGGTSGNGAGTSGGSASQGGTTDSSNRETTEEPSKPGQPSDTQKPSGDDSGNHQPSGGENNDTPSKPEKKDPDTTTPVLPRDDRLFPVDHYPGDDAVDINGKEDYAHYSLAVVPSMDADDQLYSLYEGEYLNDQRVLCSVLVYVCEDGEWKYRLTELNDNFKIGPYPEQVSGDTVELTFYYRPGAEYDWLEGHCTVDVQYAAKLLIEGWNSGEYIAQYMVPKNDTIVPLFKYSYTLMTGMSGELRETIPDGVFPGFSETKNGSPVDPVYEVTDTGAKVLYPLHPTNVGDVYTVDWSSRTVDINGHTYAEKMQTLTGYKGTSEELAIPYGIQALEFVYTFDEDMNLVYPEFETMTVPATVLRMNQKGYWGVESEIDYSFNVTRSYEVDADNYKYASYDGMLLNKEMTEIYDIPDAMTEITVPETVATINFPFGNHINTMHFLSETPGNYDFSGIFGATIYVPADVYLKYLAAWGKDPGGNGNRLAADGESDNEFVEDDTCIYSADGKTLLAVKNTVDGVLVVPEGVEKIVDAALASCGKIDMLILPKTIKELESGSLLVNAPEKIVFLGTEAPGISADTFEESSMLQVLISAKNAYITAWTPALGDGVNRIHFKNYQYVDDGETGFAYLDEGACTGAVSEPAGAVLLRAPANLTTFDAQTKPEITWKEIAARAFSDCGSLYMVELPETVTLVGRSAFAGCNSLQGVISYAEDTITVENAAFPELGILRFVALNAQNVSAYTYQGTASWFGIFGGNGNVDINRFSPCYYLVQEAGGVLLYGESQEDPGECYLLGATNNITGTIHLKEGTREIAGNVFSGCEQPFTVEGLQRVIAIGDSSFANSGIYGDLVLDKTLIYLGNRAFMGCKGLTSVDLDATGLDESDGYVAFGSSVFMYCSGLKSVTITGTGNYELRDQMFLSCSSLETVTFGADVGMTAIREGAFYGTAISEITIPKSVTTIGYGLFDSCTRLASVTMLSTVPPDLTGYYHYDFYFGEVQSMDAWMHVPEGSEQDYVDAWQYAILGYAESEAEDLTEAERVNARNRVRAMLGMELEEVPEEPDTGEEPDFDAPFSANTESEPVQQEDATPGDASME